MTRSSWHALAYVALFGIVLLFGAQRGRSGEKDTPLSVNVEDIGKRVILIGRLGVPLGKMMKLQGRWHYPDELEKDDSLRFTVTHVNDRKLREPVEFDIAQIKAVTQAGKNAVPVHQREKTLDGVRWTLLAYETGRITSTPDDGLVQTPHWIRPFTSELRGTVRTETSSKKAFQEDGEQR